MIAAGAAAVRAGFLYGRMRGCGQSATLRRSCQEAQDTYTTARDSAVQVYGETDQADRAAFTALKEKFEKRGDHWIAKRDSAD